MEKKHINLFLNQYVRIETKSKRFYNGYIIEVGDNDILFKDDKLNAIPISNSTIEIIEPREH